MSSTKDRFTFEQVRGFMDSPHTDWTKDDITEDIWGPGNTLAFDATEFPDKESIQEYLKSRMTGSKMRGYVEHIEEFYMRYIRDAGWVLSSLSFGLLPESDEEYVFVILRPSDKNLRRQGRSFGILQNHRGLKALTRLTWEHDEEHLTKNEAIDFLKTH